MDKMIDTKNHVVATNALNYLLYDDINIENRVFVSWDIFEKAMDDLYDKAMKYQEGHSVKFDSIYALPRGGLCLGVKMSYMTKIPLITDPSKITKSTLVIDDCTDTGRTMSKYKDNVTLVMYHKPSAIFRPNIFFQETYSQINFCWETKEERN